MIYLEKKNVSNFHAKIIMRNYGAHPCGEERTDTERNWIW